MEKILYLLSFILLMGSCQEDDVKKVLAEEVTIDPLKMEIVVSETKQLVATILPAETADRSLTWECDNTEILTIDQEGVITALKIGEANVRVSTANKKSCTCVVSVKAQTITVTPATGNVMVGKTLQLAAKVSPDKAGSITFTWSSSDDKIATISSVGLVSGVKEGRVTITATASNGLTVECVVEVIKFSSADDKVVEDKLTAILMNAPHGWLSSSPIYSGSKFNRFLEMNFMANKAVTIASESSVVKQSSYFFDVKGDNKTLTLDTYTGFIEPGIVLDPAQPIGPKMAMEFKVKSYTENEFVLTFDKGFIRELTLTKQTAAADFSKQKAIRTKMAEGRTRILKDFLSTNIGCKPNLTLCVTKGVEGATVDSPVKSGCFYSSMTATVDLAFNWKTEFSQYCSIIVFTETGFVSGIPIQFGDKYISNFKYNTALNRFEIDEAGIEGHFECFNLPQYQVAGVYDTFLSDYSLYMRNFFPETLLDMKKKVSNASYNSETKLKVIDTYLVTKYNRREPIVGDDGAWAIDEKSKKYDYNETDLLGEGMLFCFEYYYQFFYYFVPLKTDKLGEDIVRFTRKGETQCVTKVEGDAAIIKAAYDNNDTINAFIDKICDDKGLLIKKSEIEGSFDFDFRFIANPDQWFIARNQ